ncbi:MAG: efflux RND transporter periplasmic adaptor subunit [Acidobacteriota bacterium]|nr:efflux RND transporter periplasmic adaptor subunit [Acidobacteriota bacterium]MDW3229663.1 efflux RND transporter periplasmic adaptor subunit [Acidobacteriota bacterium]
MSKITRPVKGILIVLVICCLAAAGFWLYKKPDKEPSPSEESSPAATSSESQASSPLPVKATVVRVADLEKRIKSPGEAFTEKNVVLKAEVKGVLKKLNIREGQHVRTGEILAELDDTPYRLRLEQEEASRLKALSELLLDRLFQQPELADNSEDLLNVKKAEEAYLKAKQAFEEGLISQSELEKLRRDYELAMIGSGLKRDEIIASSKGLTQAEVNVKIAQMELEKTRITAPFSGVITQIRVAPGESIEAGREICTLVDLSQLKIEAKVLETVVGKIKTGREAYVNFTAFPGKVFRGQVAAISPLVDPKDKTCSVFVHLDNPAEEIKPGMHAEVEIISEIFPSRLLVPQEAVLVRGGRPLVFVVENGLAKWRYIQTGEENERFIEVLEGVTEGEQVIVEGHMTLAHDSSVRVID